MKKINTLKFAEDMRNKTRKTQVNAYLNNKRINNLYNHHMSSYNPYPSVITSNNYVIIVQQPIANYV